LVVSPITVGYAGHTTAVWNAVVTGLIIAALSILSLRQQIQYTPRAARGSGDTMGQRAQPR
ncbi:MAG: SPW repeat protein, partial [Ktedonobacterales bacterium]|nr:SPW repeat protein [Ktedonobacterales bacterium]